MRLGSYWGQRVAERRQALGLTQADLATLCGITQQAVSRIENGKVVPLDRLKVVIAHRLGTTPQDIFAWPTMTEEPAA